MSSPPSVVRLVALLAAAGAVLAAAAAEPDPPAADDPRARFDERIEVGRLLVEVRAVDTAGEPISGLAAADLRAWIGGREARVEAADRLGDGRQAAADPESWRALARQLAASGETVAPDERLTVLFVQADFAPSRLAGHLRMLQRTDLLLDALEPGDRMAVVSFDSHLRLRQDFTADRDRLAAALVQAIRFGGVEAPRPPGPYPSLARHLDFAAATDAANPERALELTARALAALPGSRTILFLGWGLGELDARAGSVSMGREYREARQVLTAARIPVFVLDVSDSAAHSLEVGLQQVADDTGGSYERMAFFPDQAAKRIVRAIAGGYLLVLESPAGLGPGEHRLRIELASLRGRVLAPRTLTVE